MFKNALDLSSGGKFNLALQEWNIYLESYPDDAAGLSNRGNVRLVIGDLEGSIDDQNKAISLNPSEIDPYINRGIAEEALGLWSQAKKDYMFVISQDNKNFSALYNLARISRGTPRIALRLLRRVRDYAQVVKKTNLISVNLIKKALNSYQIDEKGLDSLDRQYLSFLSQNNNPTGLDAIAAGLGDDSSMLEFVVEPYLIQIGFLTRTPRGRLLTALGKEYIDSEK